MLMTPRPLDITTHEENILWSFTQIKTNLSAATISTQYPKQIIEAQGYYASEVVSVQEISSVDGGPRHILRILMPVVPAYYGSSNPVWKFVRSIIGGGGVGMEGFLIPGGTDRFRLNTTGSGAFERLPGGSATWVNLGGSFDVLSVHYALDGKFYTSGKDGKNYSVSPTTLEFTLVTPAAYAVAISSPPGPIGL